MHKLGDNEIHDRRIENTATWVRRVLAITLCAMLYAAPATAQDASRNAGSVSSGTFTSNVSNGDPVDYRQAFDTSTRIVYYVSEVLNLQGQKVIHRWKLEGKVMQEVPISVERARQSVWSKNVMQPDQTGNWKVEVVNGRGEVIGIDNFAYNPPL